MGVKKFFLKNKFIIIILFLSIPTFALMLRPGIFSMQDFPYFRLVEFDKCIKSLQFPCRWAGDSGAGYGEPVFNFYGQFSFWIGEIFHFLSFNLIDSLKLIFITSFVGSAIAMFFLSRKIWGNNLSALISSIIYLYAPYRSVDVWVRSALPEAFSFVFFPLIILELENYLNTSKKKHLLLLSLLIGFLVVNHNLSVILFAPFLLTWIVFRFLQIKKIKPFVELIFAGAFSLFLSAFYILPVIFESKFVNINSTTVGYFDWRIHFATLHQLFISRFWGYGGSTWGPNDGLSLSIGQMQWIIPATCLLFFILSFLKRKFTNKKTDLLQFTILFLIGIFALFLTHNKSTFIWNTLPFMKYIQFPWRFLGTAAFAFALASGLIIKQFERFKWLITVVIVAFTIALNFSFFKPDIWYKVSDKDMQTGARWDEARFSSIGDYWPNFGHKIPDKISDGKYINYFPGWSKQPDKNGLIFVRGASFSDTPIRAIGNWVSLIAATIWLIIFVRLKYVKNTTKQ